MGTHTYAIVEISKEAWEDIADQLRKADYGHAFHGDLIDMHGLAVRKREEKDGSTSNPNGKTLPTGKSVSGLPPDMPLDRGETSTGAPD